MPFLIVRKKIDQPYSRNEDIESLLDRRETSFRLSPLLFIVSAGKNAVTFDANHREVAKLLLKAGANPDAKDALGKQCAIMELAHMQVR